MVLFPLRRPVCLAAMWPTFPPGGVPLATVVGLPTWCCLPPWGWLYAAWWTPLGTGQSLCWAVFLYHWLPALSIGFSSLPPPAITPIWALHSLESTTVVLLGSLM